MEDFPLLIADVNSPTEKHTVYAPFNGAAIGTLTYADEASIETALSTAHKLYRDRDQWIPMAQRIEILEKTVALMTERMEHLALEAAREGGKPLQDSRVEAARAIDGVKICIETLRTEAGKVIPMRYNVASGQRVAFTQKEPIGVVVAVSAFNHPLNLIVHQVAAAFAAGCPVIVKPASDTPLSCMRFLQILHEAGCPLAWAQGCVVASNDLASRLVTDARVAFFSFIGSAGVGWHLRNQLAPGTRCALEHGGVAPVIMAADANLEVALPLLTKGGFYHAGQVCVSVQRVFAHQSIAEQVATGLAERAGQLIVGDPTLADTDVGPLIRHSETQRVKEWVDEAVNAGAKLICGGKVISDSTYECTVLYDPPADVRVSNSEVFGPVVCVYPFTELDDAIARANSLPVSFQSAVFTQNLETAMRAYQRLDASAVMINDHTAFRVDGMPFAGLRVSGHGVGGIPYSMEDMQIEKNDGVEISRNSIDYR